MSDMSIMTECLMDGCGGTPYSSKGLCGKHYQRWRKHGDPSISLRPELEMTFAERFHSKYAVASDGCWLWTAGLGHTGYAAFHSGTKDVYAHRWAYEQFVGPIPDGLELDHTCHTSDKTCAGGIDCRHRRCVNPAHLEPVTTRENVHRGLSFAAAHAAKTHCKKGHPFDEQNTIVRSDGGRACRTCRREVSRRWWAKQKVDI